MGSLAPSLLPPIWGGALDVPSPILWGLQGSMDSSDVTSVRDLVRKEIQPLSRLTRFSNGYQIFGFRLVLFVDSMR